MGEELDVHRYNVDILYEVDDEPHIVDNQEVGRIQRRRFRFRADKEFLQSCLAYGATVVAVGATIYFLKDKFSIDATPIAANSVIFQVVVPKKSSGKFEKLLKDGMIQSTLQNVFDDLGKSIESALGKKWRSAISEKVLQELEKIKISSVKLCSEKDLGIAIDKLEEEIAANAPKVDRGIQEPGPPPQPESVRVKENPKSPSTSVIVFYQCRGGTDLAYKVVAESLDDNTKRKEVNTDEEYAVIRQLDPGQSYLIWVQSMRNGETSTKALLREPIRTAQYDPFPWRSWEAPSTAGSVIDSAYGTSSGIDAPSSRTGYDVADEASEGDGDPGLWKSELHLKLGMILRTRFPDDKMKRLLFKCDELGIVEEKDLKYLDNKEIADELKGTIKPVEILKLMDYAKDQHTASSASDAGHGGLQQPNVHYNFGSLKSSYGSVNIGAPQRMSDF